MTRNPVFVALLLLALLATSACKSRPDWRNMRARTSDSEGPDAPEIIMAKPGLQDEQPRRTAFRGRGPDFLKFPGHDDRVIARVGDEELHKSQVFDAMMRSHPEQVRATIAVLLGNRVLAAECEEHKISIDEREIDAWLVSHKALMVKQAAIDYGPETDFRTWVRLRFGQTLAEYEMIATDRERAKRLLGRLIRYHQLREDRVQIRIISTTTRDKALAIHKLAREGADFGGLAQQHSVHPSAESGGLMPPVWRGSLNPSLEEVAFDLPVGVISDIVQAKDQRGRDRFQIVRVIKRMPGEKRPYEQVEDRIVSGLLARPLSQEEWYLWQLKLESLADMKVEDL